MLNSYCILLIFFNLHRIVILLIRHSNPLRGISRISTPVRSDAKFGMMRVLLCFAQINILYPVKIPISSRHQSVITPI